MKKSKKNTHQKDRKIVDILGIDMDSTELVEVLAGVEEKISDSCKFYIVTPNPELVLSATKNPALKQAMNSADFAIPDGIGLAQAAKFLSLPAPRNFPARLFTTFFQGLAVGFSTFFSQKWLTDYLEITKGRELFLDLVKLAHKKDWRMFFLGGLDNEAELSAKKLGARFAKGPKLDNNANPISEVDTKLYIDIVKKINSFRPHLLFVAFGNPKQEIWIYKNLSKLSIDGVMAVGGSFRYVAGLSKLPPKWMEGLGLEWVWRLITEPSRIRRIFNAWPIFPLKVWMYKLSQTRV